MFRLVVSDRVTVPVKGQIADEKGMAQAFSFSLSCKRMSKADLKDRLESLTSGQLDGDDFLREVIEGWSGVQDADGKEIPYSAKALEDLLNVAGISAVAFGAYVEANSAKAKN